MEYQSPRNYGHKEMFWYGRFGGLHFLSRSVFNSDLGFPPIFSELPDSLSFKSMPVRPVPEWGLRCLSRSSFQRASYARKQTERRWNSAYTWLTRTPEAIVSHTNLCDFFLLLMELHRPRMTSSRLCPQPYKAIRALSPSYLSPRILHTYSILHHHSSAI